MTDSPVAVRFVAAPDNWSRGTTPIRAITVHMAEGGGTVSWLTRNDGNSSHYVVEYDGDVVQMVAEARAAGSINPAALRAGDDAAVHLPRRVDPLRPYGRHEGPRLALHEPERRGHRDRGRGLRRDRPERCPARVAEAAHRRHPQASREARLPRAPRLPELQGVPGHRIPWVDYGGHAVVIATVPTPAPAPAPQEEIVKGYSVPEQPTMVTLKPETVGGAKSRWLYADSSLAAGPDNKQLEPIREVWLVRFISADVYSVAYEPSAADANLTSQEMFVRSADIAKTRVVIPAVDTTPYSKEQLDATRIAGRKEGAALVKGAADAKAAELGVPA
jgi:hypothetical protein